MSPSNYFFDQTTRYLGSGATDVMYLLVVTSLFAAFLAFHFNTARYMQGLAIDGLLPQRLRRRNRRYGAPVAASATQLALVVVASVVYGSLELDPYLGLGVSMFSLGIAGIVLVQAIASLAIVSYFVKNRVNESTWAALFAPALGAIGLAAGFVLMIHEYSTLTGSEIEWINLLPVSLGVAAIIGILKPSKKRRGNLLAPPPGWQPKTWQLHR